jgi:hypothetical protein
VRPFGHDLGNAFLFIYVEKRSSFSASRRLSFGLLLSRLLADYFLGFVLLGFLPAILRLLFSWLFTDYLLDFVFFSFLPTIFQTSSFSASPRLSFRLHLFMAFHRLSFRLLLFLASRRLSFRPTIFQTLSVMYTPCGQRILAENVPMLPSCFGSGIEDLEAKSFRSNSLYS